MVQSIPGELHAGRRPSARAALASSSADGVEFGIEIARKSIVVNINHPFVCVSIRSTCRQRPLCNRIFHRRTVGNALGNADRRRFAPAANNVASVFYNASNQPREYSGLSGEPRKMTQCDSLAARSAETPKSSDCCFFHPDTAAPTTGRIFWISRGAPLVRIKE